MPSPGAIVAPVSENPSTDVAEVLTINPSGEEASVIVIPSNSNWKPPTSPLK